MSSGQWAGRCCPGRGPGVLGMGTAGVQVGRRPLGMGLRPVLVSSRKPDGVGCLPAYFLLGVPFFLSLCECCYKELHSVLSEGSNP